MGIRMAIGCTSAGVLGLVLKRGMRLVVCGLAAGLLCAFLTHCLLASLLYGISDTDPSTYATVILLVGTVTFAACGLPAWRAARINPIAALREG